MNTELVHLEAMLLGGVGFYGDPFSKRGGWDSENEIGKAWNRFAQYLEEHPKRSYSCAKSCMYEVHITGNETAEKGHIEIFVGEEVNTPQLPFALSVKFFPGGDYLKVTLSGREIDSDWWMRLDTEILPAMGLKQDDRFIIQAYDQRFLGMDRLEESTMDAYIPLKR